MAVNTAINYERVIVATRGDVKHESEMRDLVDTVNDNTSKVGKQPIVTGEARLFPTASVPTGWTANAWTSPDASVVWATRNA